MAFTATIGGQALADLAQEDGQYLKDFFTTPVWDRRSYHPPGTRGEMVCKMGSIAEKIVVAGKIITQGELTWYNVYKDLIDAWADSKAPFEIVGPNGVTFTRCYMQPESMYMSSPLISMGDRNGRVFGEFRVAFINYAGNP